MAVYCMKGESYKVQYCPEDLTLTVIIRDKSWEWCREKAGIEFACSDKNGDFTSADCISEEFSTGVSHGIRAVYSNFKGSNIVVNTAVVINNTDSTLSFELFTENEAECEVKKVYWPAAFRFDIPENHGYTILPLGQGTLIPSRWHKRIRQYYGGEMFCSDGCMAFYGQIDSGCGYCAIYDTPYDAGYISEHTPGGETLVRPYWRSSLGTTAYKRVMKYVFVQNGDYNDLCKIYRRYMIEKGRFVTLKEKIIRNPNIAKLIGTPIVHDVIATHISADSDFYSVDNPEANDWYNTFDSRAELLKRLKENGVERAYLHYDGWGAHGYDNQHPDPFPVNEAAGGTEGMKRLADTAKELGYIFGVHDQYRDYYYDGDSFSFENAIEESDGSHPYCSIWYGGKHSFLCSEVARDYVKRNYTQFKKLGINVEGAYLDVFSIVYPDECFNKNHRVTREQCMSYRRECLDYLSSQGIIPSSEEITDAILPSLALCHHSPFALINIDGKQEPIGIPVPLITLVYHECAIVPWFEFLWGLLCGGTIYYSPSETLENIERGKTALRFHEKVALCEMVKHEFIDRSYRKHRAVYSDGSVVEIDLDTLEYNVYKC